MKKIYSLALIGLASLAFGQISLTAAGTAYTQNFDTLASTGSANSTTLTGALEGWSIIESGSNANTTYAANDGSGNGGNTYSYGSTGSTDRALGGLASNNLTTAFGAQFTNNTGAPLTSLLISYVGEEWRYGGSTAAVDLLAFEYSLNATSLESGTWTAVSSLNYNTTNTAAANGAVDGNNVANRTVVSGSITGLNIPNGATVWIRFTDVNITGNDDGLAIDDFSLTGLAGNLAVTDFKKVIPNFIKNTLVKNDEIVFGSDVKDIKVYTLSGAIVKTGDVKNGSTLNVAELAKGNYIVTGIVNNQPVSQKILKD